MTRVVLVHGAATSAAIWDRVRPLLSGLEVVAVDRPRTGSLQQEVAWLAERAQDSWVVGVSGGATLGLALAATGVPLQGAVLHEPAVGSLAPGLLTPMVAAFEAGGTEAFARTLYGASWTPVEGADWLDDEVTARELAMFSAFEPSIPDPAAGRVVTTIGWDSPPQRGDAARALHASFGIPIVDVPEAGHFAPWDAAPAFAATIRNIVERAITTS